MAERQHRIHVTIRVIERKGKYGVELVDDESYVHVIPNAEALKELSVEKQQAFWSFEYAKTTMGRDNLMPKEAYHWLRANLEDFRDTENEQYGVLKGYILPQNENTWTKQLTGARDAVGLPRFKTARGGREHGGAIISSDDK